MTYKLTHSTIDSMSIYLERLYNAGESIVVFPASIHFKLNEALAAAAHLHHPKYRKLRGQWIIKRTEVCYCVPKSLKLPSLEKPYPRFSEVVNPLVLLKGKRDAT